MQFIRSYQIFCLLRDLAILWWKKFRTYRCIKHIQKYRFQFLILTGISIILYQMAYQRLRNGCIDSVHGHMITIISRPPKSQLRHISGSDDHAPFLVSNIHQHLGTLSCL